MDGYTSATTNSHTPTPTAMFVSAIFAYDAEQEQMGLSFKKGDVIQVIRQLETGWWDGLLDGKRGWFPSNYCQVISNSIPEQGEPEEEEDDDEDNDDGEEDKDSGYGNKDHDQNPEQEQEEAAAFWIPQTTPEGRLYYYNTLTGVSSMELPLEPLSIQDESGPRDRNHVHIPESTRPPPERMAAGYEREEDETDYELSGDEGFASRNRNRSNNQTSSWTNQKRDTSSNNPYGVSSTSFTAGPTANLTSSHSPPRQLFNDGQVGPLTWNALLEDFHRAVERYRYSVDMSHRSNIVRRAEDISDHLRLLLAAASGTTDNHSGNSSIISSNKALHPLFRDAMAGFSKLILSSHVATADYPPPDSHSKCLRQADGMLKAVYEFVSVAKQQRGEEIPRLVPGFLAGSNTGGTWFNNSLSTNDLTAAHSRESHQLDSRLAGPDLVGILDASSLEKLLDLELRIEASIHKLGDQLVLQDKLITPLRHKTIGDGICKSGAQILELYRRFISTIESINLAPLGVDVTDPQIREYNSCKQRVFDQTSDLLLACQAIASPLADEWAERRSDSLQDRLRSLAIILKDLERSNSKLIDFIRIFLDNMPSKLYFVLTHRDQVGNGLSKNPQTRHQRASSSSRNYEELYLPEAARSGGGSAKLERIFGEIPAPLASPLPPPTGLEDLPDFLSLDHDHEMSYDFKSTPPILRGGTLVALVEQLTRHDRLDSDFNNTFLLTYQSFTTANTLFEMLIKRWGIQPPGNLGQKDYQLWIDKKQKPIQFRVVNILKNWFDSYFMEGDTEEANNLMQRVMTFAKEHVATTNTPGAAPLMTSVEQRMNGPNGASNKRLVLTLNQSSPQPVLPKNIKKLKFLDIDATEFARQLTIVEARLYNKIKAEECLTKTWQKKIKPGDPDPAPNIKALILHSNQLTNWVAQMILNQSDVRRRVLVIKHFITIADKCRAMHNYSTLTSIISSLATAPIDRLSRTWTQTNAKTVATLEVLRGLMSSSKNFTEYRETLHKSNPPCIPFLGVFLTDLTFIEDGIPSIIKKNNLINFAKRAKSAEVIRDIQQYQNVPYNLQPVAEMQEYIINSMMSAKDVHEMYERSLIIEPKEREDEKIARLLMNLDFFDEHE